jgi:hypothetical protein
VHAGGDFGEILSAWPELPRPALEGLHFGGLAVRRLVPPRWYVAIVGCGPFVESNKNL